jgi:hypothetical protein
MSLGMEIYVVPSTEDSSCRLYVQFVTWIIYSLKWNVKFNMGQTFGTSMI